MNNYQNNGTEKRDGLKRNRGIKLVGWFIGVLFIYLIFPIIVNLVTDWVKVKYLYLATPILDDQEWNEKKETLPPPKKVKIPDLPEIPLRVLDYSSQRNASYPASAVVDEDTETLWISGSSSQPHALMLRPVEDTAFEITALQICTTSSNGQHADMAVRNVTLFSSQELNAERTLYPVGTYELPSGDGCSLCKFPEPRMLRVLIIQVNETSGSSSALLSEVVAYGHQGEIIADE